MAWGHVITWEWDGSGITFREDAVSGDRMFL